MQMKKKKNKTKTSPAKRYPYQLITYIIFKNILSHKGEVRPKLRTILVNKLTLLHIPYIYNQIFFFT